ncbi:MAG TPA: hypothetical protein PKD37_05330 [Oligoflexia bacterium]|nr:hypothetical protein [Oligoflexia bacterium]HMP27389.1 hypothetical protein [Oligoflexia bacterium]
MAQQSPGFNDKHQNARKEPEVKGIKVNLPLPPKLELSDLAPQTEEYQKLLKDIAEFYLNNQNNSYKNHNFGPQTIKNLNKLALLDSNQDLTPQGLRVFEMICDLPKDTLPYFAHLFNYAALSLKPPASNLFFQHLEWINDRGDPDIGDSRGRDFQKLYLAIIDSLFVPHRASEERYENREKRLSVNFLIDLYLSKNPKLTSEMMETLKQEAWYGSHPFLSANSRSETAVSETAKLVGQARVHSYTLFRELTMEARRLPNGSPSLIAKFGEDCFEMVQGVHSSKIETHPGRGFLLTGPKIKKMFFLDHSSSDHLWEYKASYRYANETFEAFKETSFLLTRSYLVVINKDDRFNVDGINYSYLINNDHRIGSYDDSAFLIPTKIIERLLGKSLYNLKDGPKSGTKDLGDSSQPVSYLDLIRVATMAKMPPLNISSGSVLFGGMSNALPVGWEPLLAWERTDNSKTWKDIWGHHHLAWLVRKTNVEDREKVLQPFADYHDLVSQVVKTYQQLTNLFFLRYGAYKNQLVPYSATTQTELPLMLDYLLRWHKTGHEKGLKIRDFPVLCVLKAFQDPSNALPLVDSYNLSYYPKPSLNLSQLLGEDDSETDLLTVFWEREIMKSVVSTNRVETGAHLFLMGRDYLKDPRVLKV